MTQPRFLFDEDFRRDIVGGVRRLEPAVDLAVVQELGLSGTPDADLLELAAEEGRILVSHDVNTMTAEAIRRIEDASPMAGLFIVPQDAQGGVIAETLVAIALASEAEEWRDRLEFLPW